MLANLVGVGTLFVDLVDRHDDRHVGRLRVVERLDRLGHDPVVGSDDEDGDVGHLRTTSTHGREGLVTRGVDEGDRPIDALVLGDDLVGADVLGDAAGLSRDDVGVPDGVEQLGLAMVDVTHDRDHRGPSDEKLLVVLDGVEVDVEGCEELLLLVLGRDDLDDEAELGAEELEGVLVERLGRGRERTAVLACRAGIGLDELAHRPAAQHRPGLVDQQHPTGRTERELTTEFLNRKRRRSRWRSGAHHPPCRPRPHPPNIPSTSDNLPAQMETPSRERIAKAVSD